MQSMSPHHLAHLSTLLRVTHTPTIPTRSPVGQALVGAPSQPAPVGQAQVDHNIRPNTTPGKAVHIAELGHGSVWVQYRRHEHRTEDQLTLPELIARQNDLPLVKLSDDFGNLMEQELALSDLALRVQTIEDAAQTLFKSYIDNFEDTRRAGPP